MQIVKTNFRLKLKNCFSISINCKIYWWNIKHFYDKIIIYTLSSSRKKFFMHILCTFNIRIRKNEAVAQFLQNRSNLSMYEDEGNHHKFTRWSFFNKNRLKSYFNRYGCSISKFTSKLYHRNKLTIHEKVLHPLQTNSRWAFNLLPIINCNMSWQNVVK